MTQFATADDYEAIYGEVEDAYRVSTLLGYASAFIMDHRGLKLDPDDLVQAANLRRITCALVNRSLSAGAWSGFSSVSQGAGGQTASVTLSNPAGDFYLTKQERRILGVGGGRIGQTDPYGEAHDA